MLGNLFALNEQPSTTLNHKLSYNKISGYGAALYNPLNAISIYIKALEHIKNFCDLTIEEYKNDKKISPNISPKLSAEKKIKTYQKLDKISQIILEFRKGIALPTTHELYKHFQVVDKKFNFLDETLHLAFNTYNYQYYEEAKAVVNHLINFFIEMQKIAKSNNLNQ